MDKTETLKEIERALAECDSARGLGTDSRGVAKAETGLLAMIDRFAPPGSVYRQQMEQARAYFSTPGNPHHLTLLRGIVEALRDAIDRGALATFRELIHAEVFSDYLEMAQYLVGEGYKDPAAVIVGSTLEQHLRKLCGKYNVPVDAKGRPKKATRLNDDLKGAGAYGALEHKQVLAWLDLRNKAAHGHYDEYGVQEVRLMLEGVRQFMARFLPEA